MLESTVCWKRAETVHMQTLSYKIVWRSVLVSTRMNVTECKSVGATWSCVKDQLRIQRSKYGNLKESFPASITPLWTVLEQRPCRVCNLEEGNLESTNPEDMPSTLAFFLCFFSRSSPASSLTSCSPFEKQRRWNLCPFSPVNFARIRWKRLHVNEPRKH